MIPFWPFKKKCASLWPRSPEQLLMGLSVACSQSEGKGCWGRDLELTCWAFSTAEPRKLGKSAGASPQGHHLWDGRDRPHLVLPLPTCHTPLQTQQGVGPGGVRAWASEKVLLSHTGATANGRGAFPASVLQLGCVK